MIDESQLDRWALQARLAYKNEDDYLKLEMWLPPGVHLTQEQIRRDLQKAIRCIEAQGWDHVGTERVGGAAEMMFARSERPPGQGGMNDSGCAVVTLVALIGAIVGARAVIRGA